MAVKIRLTRVGRKKAPFYRIVVADGRKARDGRFIEIIGIYQPLGKTPTIKVKEERALYWLGQGAIPSDTTRSILKKFGIMKTFHEIKLQAKKTLKEAKLSD